MPTIDDLRSEILAEKGLLEVRKRKEMEENEKRKLTNELSSLKNERKYAKFKPVISGIKTAFNQIANKVGEAQKAQADKDRQNKAIRKKGFNSFQPRRGIFG